jgi:hypothetical protein
MGKNVNIGDCIKMDPTFFNCTFVGYKLSALPCIGIAIAGALNIMGEKIS